MTEKQAIQKSSLKIRELKNPRLRKIRYELRTLIFLEFLSRCRKNGTRDLYLPFHRHPICCFVCHNRMEDLIQSPDSLFWFCRDHFDFTYKKSNHNNFFNSKFHDFNFN